MLEQAAPNGTLMPTWTSPMVKQFRILCPVQWLLTSWKMLFFCIHPAHWSKETVGLDACGYRTSLELGQSRLVWRLNSSKWAWTLLDPFGSTLFLLASSYLSDLSIAKWEGFCLRFQWLTASHVRRKCRRQKFCLTRSASMLWLEHVRKDSGFMRLLSSLEVTQHNETMWSHACIGDAADTSRHLGGI